MHEWHTGTQTHTLENAPLGRHLGLNVADEALSNLSDRHKMSRTARGTRADTDAHTHTNTQNVAQNECAQLRIIPSGQIYVFGDIQVAVEDGAQASE